jgi:hypothetical protein
VLCYHLLLHTGAILEQRVDNSLDTLRFLLFLVEEAFECGTNGHNDDIKTQYCLNNFIKLIRVKYNDVDSGINEIISIIKK